MNNISDVGNYFTSQSFIASVVVICVMIVMLTIIKKYLIKKVAYTTKDEQHQNTFIGVIFNVLQYVVVLGAVVIVLQLHGVNVTSIVAGLGIVATLVGLALQDTMKDIISGINIYNNNFYKVGDLVIYEGQLCDVKYFSARVTKLTSFVTGNTFTLCNSTINSIEKVKNNTNIKLIFDFEDDKKKIDKCFENAGKAIQDEKDLVNVEYYSLIDITDAGNVYLANIVAPGHKAWPIKVKYVQALEKEFKKAKISPSFNDERKILNIKK